MILRFLPAGLLPDTEHIGYALVRIAFTVIVAWLLQRACFLLVRRAERWLVRAAKDSVHAAQRAKTLGQITRHSVTTLVGAGALVHVLEILGWDVKPLLVGASILGAALGFGAQFLVRDLIAGAFILVEDQFSVGDRIEINGQLAVVEELTLRSTRLRDFNGRLLFVPNGEMKIVVNQSRGWTLATVDLPLAPNQDFDRAIRIAEEAAAAINADEGLRALLQEPLRVVGLERIGASGALLRMAAKAHPGGGAVAVTREARRLALSRLREAHLRIASVYDSLGVGDPNDPPAR